MKKLRRSRAGLIKPTSAPYNRRRQSAPPRRSFMRRALLLVVPFFVLACAHRSDAPPEVEEPAPATEQPTAVSSPAPAAPPTGAPSKASAPQSVRVGRVITAQPSGPSFTVPEDWLTWWNSFHNNFHLAPAELKAVEKGSGDW